MPNGETFIGDSVMLYGIPVMRVEYRAAWRHGCLRRQVFDAILEANKLMTLREISSRAATLVVKLV